MRHQDDLLCRRDIGRKEHCTAKGKDKLAAEIRLPRRRAFLTPLSRSSAAAPLPSWDVPIDTPIATGHGFHDELSDDFVHLHLKRDPSEQEKHQPSRY
jgi:hypothetical protein